MIIPKHSRQRPLIFAHNGIICHEGKGPSSVLFTKELISVDCTDITPEALELLCSHWKRYKRRKGSGAATLNTVNGSMVLLEDKK